MEKSDKGFNWKISYSLAILSGVLLLLSYPPLRFGGFLAWIALVPLFIAIYYESKAKRVDKLAGVACLGLLPLLLFAIPAVKGVEFGSGFSAAGKRVSENNDPFVIKDGKIITATNNAGGVLGGISSGMPIIVRVAVKPTSSIAKNQETVNMANMEKVTLGVRGRHDVCIVPRAVPVVEAMMAITLCDFAMRAGFISMVIK